MELIVRVQPLGFFRSQCTVFVFVVNVWGNANFVLLMGNTVAPDFFEPFIPTTIPTINIVTYWIVLIVILMIDLVTFDRVENRGIQYRRDHVH